MPGPRGVAALLGFGSHTRRAWCRTVRLLTVACSTTSLPLGFARATEARVTAPAPSANDSATTASEDPGSSAPEPLTFTAGDAELFFGSRVLFGWDYELHSLAPPDTHGGGARAFLRQARVSIDGGWQRRAGFELDVDLSDPESPLRDAWLEARIASSLHVRVGRFKRPYSRLELQSASTLPLRRRGLGNDLVVDSLGYGGRGVGTELSGKLEPLSLRGAIAVTVPPQAQGHFDLNARVEHDLHDALRLGASGVARLANRAPATQRTTLHPGLGVDALVRAGSVSMVVDALFVDAPATPRARGPADPTPRQDAAVIAAYLTYDIELLPGWTLQPVLFGEWVRRRVDGHSSQAVRGVGGVSVLWCRKRLRLMPQLELVRPLHDDRGGKWSRGETASLMISAQL